MAKDVGTREEVTSTKKVAGTNGRGVLKTPIQGTSIEDLSTRLNALEGVNEDMATFLAHNWQRFFGALCVVLLGVVLYHQYQGTQDARHSESAQRFDEARRQFGRVVAPEAPAEGTDAVKDAESQSATLLEQLKLLESSQGDNFYGKVAGLYRAQTMIQQGHPAEAETALQDYKWKSFENIRTAKRTADVKDNALETELAALLEARALISKGDETETLKGRNLLVGLVLGGRFLNLEALLALYRISETPEHRKEADDRATELITARPELHEIIQSQLAGAGIAVKESK